MQHLYGISTLGSFINVSMMGWTKQNKVIIGISTTLGCSSCSCWLISYYMRHFPYNIIPIFN
ncbi:hypothetical protein A9196_05780 [Aeromonas dhakensis]|nr:hypothetical protein A9196_05780 [Aeromonas dhakensis]